MKTIASIAVKGNDERIFRIPLVTSETMPTPKGNSGSVMGEVTEANQIDGDWIKKYPFINMNIPAIMAHTNPSDLSPDSCQSKMR